MASKMVLNTGAVPKGTAYITVVRFSLDEEGVTADVYIKSNGCPDVEDGWRTKRFPATMSLAKLGDYVGSMKGKQHPRHWKMA